MDDAATDPVSDLVDLTGLSLDDLPSLGDAPLAHSIRRILAESRDDAPSVVAGHESSM